MIGCSRVQVALSLWLVCLVAGSSAAQQCALGHRFVVSSGHPDATAAGLSILRRGGNVIDAAVATSLALGVAEPYASGLGGKLVLLYREASSGQVICIEALCPSASRIDPDAFSRMSRQKRYSGYTAVGVPGCLAGLAEAHRRWGSQNWSELVQPAIDLAERGVEITPKIRSFFDPDDLRTDPETARIYLPSGSPPPLGSRLHHPDLAESLRLIRDDGAAAFYDGPITQQIVQAAQAAGAPLQIDDFRRYRPRVTTPLATNYRRYCVYSSPPPLTGGVTVLAALEYLERLPMGRLNRTQLVDQMGRGLQSIYPRVTDTVADVPSARGDALDILLHPTSTARKLVSKLQPNALASCNSGERSLALRPAARVAGAVGSSMPRTTALKRSPNDKEPEPTMHAADGSDFLPEASTSHLCVMDARGNMVSLTQSLSLHFGAGVTPPGTGILLNNSMSNFATRNAESVNYIGAGKRARSTIAPVLVTRCGRPCLALGIPGGQRIPTTTLQLLYYVLDYGMPLDMAFDQPRFHLRRPMTEDDPSNRVDLEDGTEPLLEQQLRGRGWSIVHRPRDGHYFGGGNGIARCSNGTMMGVADTRRTNFADGD